MAWGFGMNQGQLIIDPSETQYYLQVLQEAVVNTSTYHATWGLYYTDFYPDASLSYDKVCTLFINALDYCAFQTFANTTSIFFRIWSKVPLSVNVRVCGKRSGSPTGYGLAIRDASGNLLYASDKPSVYTLNKSWSGTVGAELVIGCARPAVNNVLFWCNDFSAMLGSTYIGNIGGAVYSYHAVFIKKSSDLQVTAQRYAFYQGHGLSASYTNQFFAGFL